MKKIFFKLLEKFINNKKKKNTEDNSYDILTREYNFCKSKII